jgi:MFS family permease
MTIISDWKTTIKAELYNPFTKEDRDLDVEETLQEEEQTSVESSKGLGKYWTIITAGAGLFSDGYVNNSIGTANTILGILYPKEYIGSAAQANVSSIAFAGTVVGQLFFGYVADYHSRKIGMIASTLILIIFTILAAGSWGANGSIYGMLAALTAYRFFLGIGIGGEYPAGSVAAAEATMALGRGRRNRWFVWVTDFMIDTGFVVSSFVPLVLLWIFGTKHLTIVWRLTIGLGAIPPCSLFFLRLKWKDNGQFKKNNMKNVSTPYWLAIKFYWRRLLVVSLIWFMYDFSAYSFGIYSSAILNVVIPDNNLYQTFGWNTLLNFFYLPGSFLGAYAADYFGPRLCLVFGVGTQGIIGFIMAAKYQTLEKHIAAFTVVMGIFLSLGEFGPGDQIGLISSKTAATSIRGQYYGVASSMGKIGAFVGTHVFPTLIKHAGGADSLGGKQAPFWVSSSLCMFSAFLALFFLPPLTQDAIQDEDIRFKEYLLRNGFDISKMGDAVLTSAEEGSVVSEEDKAKNDATISQVSA